MDEAMLKLLYLAAGYCTCSLPATLRKNLAKLKLILKKRKKLKEKLRVDSESCTQET